MARLPIDHYFMLMAKLVSTRSTCTHRHQGVVLVRNKHVLATGYNGAAPDQPHCDEIGYCAKDNGEGYCRADGLHGESNAIASAASEGFSLIGADAYCIYSPCRTCCNLFRTSGIKTVIYDEVYSNFKDGPAYLEQLGIESIQLIPSLTIYIAMPDVSKQWKRLQDEAIASIQKKKEGNQ